MKVRKIESLLSSQTLCGTELLDTEVTSACGSDMMSDVLAFVKEQSVMLTGLVNPQVIRTAEMMDMKCIVFVRGKKPTVEMVELAEACGMILMSTQLNMYEACGILYSAGLGA